MNSETLAAWVSDFPLLRPMIQGIPVNWFNPAVAPMAEAKLDIDLERVDVEDATARLERFAPFLAEAFPELQGSRGIIESELEDVEVFASELALRYGLSHAPRLFLKKDSHLPIAGSVKARGGIYEVLAHAEKLAISTGLLTQSDDYRILLSPPCRALFQEHKIAVGSTGNLGMSIGIAAAAFGFDVTVHMSSDARPWKKERLRGHGVWVVEHDGDYGEAVERGRQEAEADPCCHFVDDENSRTLFVGYATAGMRLKTQLSGLGHVVDADHPLFVYLPCGVGGAPGGISFGLKLAFGDHVHCIFAEPTQSPCMLLGVYTGLHDKVCVQDFGISNRTAADGLAVSRASGFVGRAMQRMVDGYYTVTDEEMYALLYLLEQSQGLRLEPSALAGAPGFARVMRDDLFRNRLDLDDRTWRNALHIVWATGGGMVPEQELSRYSAIGKRALQEGRRDALSPEI
ncbi:D-serine ammonia-lyase [Variovorax sp. tm]|uniref:D-serine ammonia-lyase n=1 Tax=Variovorax atrisoli TaxID=3394203 RepID=UPI003A804259